MVTLTRISYILFFVSFVVHGMKAPKTIINGSVDQVGQTDNLNKLDEHGKAPLHYAALQGDCDEIALLLRRGASISTKTSDTGATVFHIAAEMDNEIVKKTLLFFALLQQGDALIKAISDSTQNKPFALKVLQERAVELKKLLQVTTKDGQTACAFEKKQNPNSAKIDSSSPLLSAHKVHTDLQSFIIAIEQDTILELPDNNIYRAAYNGIPRE